MRRNHAKLLMIALVVAVAAGCASHRSRSKPEKPMPLADIKTLIDVERAWQAKVGGAEPKQRLGLGLAADGSRVFIAGPGGEVKALDLASGRTQWDVKTSTELSGGPGAGDRLVLVGGADGDVIALSAADGHELWRHNLNAEILSAPATDDGVVVVRTLDGKLYGLAAADGEQRWVIDQTVPSLTLRGIAAPLLADGHAYAGFDNGRLVSAVLNGGAVVWDIAVSQARGSTALQRMVDIDSPVAIDGNDLFVVGYQGKVARLARDTGQVLWTRDLSSYRGLAIDADGVYVSTADGEVVKLDRRNGVEKWRQRGLLRRQLSAPAILAGHVVVGDLDGVVHWLDSDDGSFIARSRAGKPVRAAPRVAGDTLLVDADDGTLSAFRIRAPRTARVAGGG